MQTTTVSEQILNAESLSFSDGRTVLIETILRTTTSVRAAPKRSASSSPERPDVPKRPRHSAPGSPKPASPSPEHPPDDDALSVITQPDDVPECIDLTDEAGSEVDLLADAVWTDTDDVEEGDGEDASEPPGSVGCSDSEEESEYKETPLDPEMKAALDIIDAARPPNKDVGPIRDFIAEQYPELAEKVVSNHNTPRSLAHHLLKHLYATASETQISATMPRVRELVNAYTSTPFMQDKDFQTLRNVLKRRFGENSKIVKRHKRFGVTLAEYKAREGAKKETRAANLRERKPISQRDMNDLIDQFSTSDVPEENIVAVMAATGARLIDALRVSKFLRIPGDDKAVLIRGVAKKGAKGVDFEVRRPIYRLSMDELQELVKLVRTRYKDLQNVENADATSTAIGKINAHIKKLKFRNINSSRDMRKAYAMLSYYQLPEERRKCYQQNQWVQDVLGHENFDTSANYTQNYLQRDLADDVKTPSDVQAAVAELRVVDAKQGKQIDRLGDAVQDVRADVQGVRKNVQRAELACTRTAKKGGRSPTNVFATARVLDRLNTPVIIEYIREGPARQDGNTPLYALELMKELHAKRVEITGTMLKTKFNFSSTLVSDPRITAEIKRLNMLPRKP